MTLTIGQSDGKRFALPADVATLTMAVLAKKGAGKTYLAGVLEEEFAKAGIPFIVLDPIGVHYGIRSVADGSKAWPPGRNIVVFGGEHGDVPIERNVGADVARVVMADNLSAVIDLSELSKTAWREFVRDFCLTVFRENLKHGPRHLFVEEATEFVPQTRRPELQEAYEAVERLCRLGRNKGVGLTIIAQRSAQVAKDVLSQIDVLFALRHTGKHDREAIIDALRDDLDDEQTERDLPLFRSTVTRLPDGHAWAWWPKHGVFRQVQVRERETYHAGATPTFGERVEVVTAQPDVDALRSRFAAIIKQREADDPKKLRAEIAALRRELAQPVAVADCGHDAEIQALRLAMVDEERRRSAAYRDGRLSVLREQLEGLQRAVESQEQSNEAMAPPSHLPEIDNRPRRVQPNVQKAQVRPERKPAPKVSAPASTNGHHPELTTPQRRVIDAAGALHDFGITEIAGPTLAAHAGYRYSGGFRNILSELRGRGLLTDTRPKTHALTPDGMKSADYEPITDPDDLRRRWLDLCSNSTRPLLDVLIGEYPNDISGPDLAERVGRQYSGGFRNLMSELCTMSAAVRPRKGHLRAADVLFPEGAR